MVTITNENDGVRCGNRVGLPVGVILNPNYP